MKLSEYPVGTIVNIQGGLGRFELTEKEWSGKHGQYGEEDRLLKETVDKLDVMGQVDIISAPWNVVAELVLMLQDEYGNVDAEGEDITFNKVFADAVERVKRDEDFRKRKLAKTQAETPEIKVVHQFNNEWIARRQAARRNRIAEIEQAQGE